LYRDDSKVDVEFDEEEEDIKNGMKKHDKLEKSMNKIKLMKMEREVEEDSSEKEEIEYMRKLK
jgi:hypothetical protein